jgi:hypothetical protein
MTGACHPERMRDLVPTGLKVRGLYWDASFWPIVLFRRENDSSSAVRFVISGSRSPTQAPTQLNEPVVVASWKCEIDRPNRRAGIGLA